MRDRGFKEVHELLRVINKPHFALNYEFYANLKQTKDIYIELVSIDK